MCDRARKKDCYFRSGPFEDGAWQAIYRPQDGQETFKSVDNRLPSFLALNGNLATEHRRVIKLQAGQGTLVRQLASLPLSSSCFICLTSPTCQRCRT